MGAWYCLITLIKFFNGGDFSGLQRHGGLRSNGCHLFLSVQFSGTSTDPGNVLGLSGFHLIPL